MNIDICRKCKNWREYIYLDSSKNPCCVTLKCMRMPRKRWNMRLNMIDPCKVERALENRENRTCVLNGTQWQDYVLEGHDDECKRMFGDAIRSQRVPEDCDMKVENMIKEWNDGKV